MKHIHEINEDGLILPVLIFRPDLQKTTSVALAMIGWTIWAYFFVPLFSLLGWWLGYRRFDRYVMLSDYSLFQQIQGILPIIFVLGVIFLLWAAYNMIRFRGHEKRSHTKDTTIEEMALYFEIDARRIDEAQSYQISTYHFDESGRVVDIVPKLGLQQNSIQSEPANHQSE
jgi:biofilm PGA synthesis protein PgaD